MTPAHRAFHIEHEADIGAVRRYASQLALAVGMDEVKVGNVALVATELASNVLRHATRGGALLALVGKGERRGLSITVWDRGPGMDVAICLQDGISTTGTRGVGLGAVARMATEWDSYSRRGVGTVIVVRMFQNQSPRGQGPAPGLIIGGVCVPYPGEQVAGDRWESHRTGDHLTVVVSDGLGHGVEAARASETVLTAFLNVPDDPVAAILERCHRAARRTRGAAASVVRIDSAAAKLTVAGVGNVSPWLVDAMGKPHQLPVQHGTLGHYMPRIRSFEHPFLPGSHLVVASDGLKTQLSVSGYPGLLSHSPEVIAGVLWRDNARERDDATVVVARRQP